MWNKTDIKMAKKQQDSTLIARATNDVFALELRQEDDMYILVQLYYELEMQKMSFRPDLFNQIVHQITDKTN